MSVDREAQFKKLVVDFPNSPMGYFSLGRLYLEQRRYREAADTLENAVRLQADYAAALVALGDAYAGAKDPKAAATFEKARAVALAQNHNGLAEEITEKLTHLTSSGA